MKTRHEAIMETKTQYGAMDLYARELSVAFAEWCYRSRWYTFEDGKWRYTFEHGTAMSKAAYEKNYAKTTEQLFNIFLKQYDATKKQD